MHTPLVHPDVPEQDPLLNRLVHLDFDPIHPSQEQLGREAGGDFDIRLPREPVLLPQVRHHPALDQAREHEVSGEPYYEQKENRRCRRKDTYSLQSGSFVRAREYPLVSRPSSFVSFDREVRLETAPRRLALREWAGPPYSMGPRSFLRTNV